MRPSPVRIRHCAFLIIAIALLAHSDLKAQAVAGTAHLTITMNLQSSIGLVFKNSAAVGSPGFCPLSNAGTNNVGLDLGTASFPGGSDSLACVGYSKVGSATYRVASAFDVVVTKANTTSPSYRLAAQISSPPPADVTWLMNGIALNNTGFTLLDASDNYGTAVTKTLQVQVKNSVAAGPLFETITFLATAN